MRFLILTLTIVFFSSGSFADYKIQYNNQGAISIPKAKSAQYNSDAVNTNRIQTSFSNNWKNYTYFNFSVEKETNTINVVVDVSGNLYTASNDNKIMKINSEGNRLWTFNGHSSNVQAVEVGRDGYIYSGAKDNTVRKIDSNGNEIWVFTGHNDYVYDVVVDANGNVYSSSKDKEIKKIDKDGNELWTYSNLDFSVWSLSIDSGGYLYFVHNKKIKKLDGNGNESLTISDGFANDVDVSDF
jgi:hypothetical protein